MCYQCSRPTFYTFGTDAPNFFIQVQPINTFYYYGSQGDATLEASVVHAVEDFRLCANPTLIMSYYPFLQRLSRKPLQEL